MINSATPQETYDHMFGSGATQWSWWLSVDISGAPEGEAQDDWSAELMCEDGNGGHVTFTITHVTVLQHAKKIVSMWLGDQTYTEKRFGATVVQECANLVFAPDNCDFDAESADSFLQAIVLGEVVFG